MQTDADPGPAPETFGEYKKKGEESNGVLAMIDALVADLKKETAEMEVEESNAQEEYEQLEKDAAKKRETDSKAIAEKEGAKADLEETLLKLKEDTTTRKKE